MKTILFFTLLFTSTCCFSQNNDEPAKAIIIHPSVGKVIDNAEKKMFQLFPEYKDDTYNNAFILKYNDTTFSVIVTNINNQMIEKPISRGELDKIYYQIDEKSKQTKASDSQENNNTKKSKRSGPNFSSTASYIATEILVQLTITAFDVLVLALVN